MDFKKFEELLDKISNKDITSREAVALFKNSNNEPVIGVDSDSNEEPILNMMSESYCRDEHFLSHHLVNGQPVLLGVTYASLAINSFFEIYQNKTTVHIKGLNFVAPVVFSNKDPVKITVETRDKSSYAKFSVIRSAAERTANITVAEGKIQRGEISKEIVDIKKITKGLQKVSNVDYIYTANKALSLGDTYKTIRELYVTQKQVVVKIDLGNPSFVDPHDYALHPLVINSAYLAITPLIIDCYENDTYLPFGIKSIIFSRSPALDECWLDIKLTKRSEELILFDFDIVSGDSTVVARIEGCSLKRRRHNGILSADESNRQNQHQAAKDQPTPRLRNLQLVADSQEYPREENNLQNQIESYLLQKISAVSESDIQVCDLQQNIMDLGMDSTQLVEVGTSIQADTDIELYPTLFFEYTNVEELTQYFLTEHPKQFVRLFSKNSESTSTSDGSDVNDSGSLLREKIAVIGMSGTFAQAKNLDEFWRNLVDAKDVMSEVPIDHWDCRPWYDSDTEVENMTYCKWGSFLDDVDKFDPSFFNISPREAQWMDPQVRLFMQSIYATAENSGYITKLRGSNTGVFAGVCFHDYEDKIAETELPVNPYAGINNTQTVMANRISFHLDLNGPSVAIDTACSSSLFALHYACQALRNRECDMAFVGGANLLLSSLHYRMFSSLGALSATGRCHTFDASADGYVPGECIASILLKPLSRAKADNDRIEAVILGSSALHGGYTPSLTAPSVAGEVNTLLKAWQDSGVSPESISYIEAHGTGTKLGDPIELNSLKKAFSSFTDKQNFCAIGSAKANIGHAEGAAGIAGILKVILQMKHQTIPALMGFNELNPYIDLDDSALYINKTVKQWKSQEGVPRRAGISSFGVAGAYAHVVIEEYVQEQVSTSNRRLQAPAMVVFSAKNQQQLREILVNYSNYLRTTPGLDTELIDLSFTLQLGRVAMSERLGFVVNSVEELNDVLEIYLSGEAAPNVFESVSNDENSASSRSKQCVEGELKAKVSRWLIDEDYDKVLSHWVRGHAVDWSQLYQEKSPRSVGLPTYPFAKESYWLPTPDDSSKSTSNKLQTTKNIHPLLHENTSDLSQHRYTTRLTGEEFFLSDHTLLGEKLLPGVVYLEMARAAVAKAVSGLMDISVDILLKDVVWMRPIRQSESVLSVHIELTAVNDDVIDYCIKGYLDSGLRDPIIYSTGRAEVYTASANIVRMPLIVDLPDLRRKCSETILNPEDCYKTISNMGLELGPGLRGVTQVYKGEGQLVAKLQLPSHLLDGWEDYVLHPSIMDSSLQACIGLIVGNASENDLTLPYALEELQVYGRFSTSMWAYIRQCESNSGDNAIQKRDIEIVDDSGKVCVRMKGLSFRVVGARRIPMLLTDPQSLPAAQPEQETLMANVVWKQQAIKGAGLSENLPSYTRKYVIFCELEDRSKEELHKYPDQFEYVYLHSDEKELAQRLRYYAKSIFEKVHEILKLNEPGRILLQVVHSTEVHSVLIEGIAGLLKTAQLECTQFIGQTIGFDSLSLAEGMIEKVVENTRALDQQVRYKSLKRYVASVQEMPSPNGIKPLSHQSKERELPWRENGLYLITGGMGGLGLILAKEIMNSVGGVRIFLTGRSVLDQEQQALVQLLNDSVGNATTIEYRIMDVVDLNAVDTVVSGIYSEYGHLDGVVHCAGVSRDGYILSKKLAEVDEVLGPKVSGVINLDEATKDIPLDFFVVFSSMAGVLGNVGQADYATANSLLDSYSHYRCGLVDKKMRFGRTVSINWPLWKHGGMSVDNSTIVQLQERYGLAVLENNEGINAFYASLKSKEAQVLVVSGDPRKLREKVFCYCEQSTQSFGYSDGLTEMGLAKDAGGIWSTTDTTNQHDSQELSFQITKMLRLKASSILKQKLEKIDPNSEFNDFGFDSITLGELTKELNNEFSLSLPPTVFFHYPTISRLTEHFVDQYFPVFAERYLAVADQDAQPMSPQYSDITSSEGQSIDEKNGQLKRSHQSDTVSSDNVPAESSTFIDSRNSRFRKQSNVDRNSRDLGVDHRIAIIGISGCFPMAKNISQFWENLRDGKDCISEIPDDRWDWQAIYGNPHTEENKCNVKWGGFVDGIGEFDPLFFGISPREAVLMDPQQRLLMSQVWHVIEDAGCAAENLSGSNTSIFVGSTSTGYSELLNRLNFVVEGNSATGMVPSIGPNRMSYFLNLRGPSQPIETACSSSLIAVHRAVQSMIYGGCDMAIAGGVNSIILPELHMSFNKAGMLSVDGRCKAFSDQANGFSRGEGAGMIFMKPLSAAQRDGHNIYAVIRGSAENHGGRANSLTAPNPKAQAELLICAYEQAGIDPKTVGYIEAHGTGTELGDPIEIDALQEAFRALHKKSESGGEVIVGSCGIGSVKSNIGHLELAAGIAGILKVLLQMKHKTLVKSLHCDTLNPYINLDKSPFYIVQDKREWKPFYDNVGNAIPRRAGVSSFSFGGVNAHVVLEEYIPDEKEVCVSEISQKNPVIIILSAKSEVQLQKRIEDLLAFTKENALSNSDLLNMAYTLQVGREAMKVRIALIVSSIDDLEKKLQCAIDSTEMEGIYKGNSSDDDDIISYFSKNEELREAVSKWIENKKSIPLADFWVRGLEIEWQLLYSDSKPKRMSLPSYPFSNNNYWATYRDNASDKLLAQPTSAESEVSLAVESSYKSEGACHNSKENSKENRNQVFLEKCWRTSNLTSTEREEYKGVIAIVSTSETQSLSEEVQKIIPKSQILNIDTDINRLGESESEWSNYRGVIDLVGCGEHQHQHEHHSLAWMHFLQKLVDTGTGSLMLLCVTKGLESFENVIPNMSGASRVGLYRMLQCEYSNIKSRHMDSDRFIDDRKLAAQIVAEYFVDTDEIEVCFRKGKRYEAYLKENPKWMLNSENIQLPREMVLCVTGGTRGLGFLCAKHFVTHYGVKRLVLIGQEDIPPKTQWNDYIGKGSAIAKKIEGFKALESMGVKLKVMSVRLTSSFAVRRAVKEIKSTLGNIGGVLHCAGSISMERPAFIRKTAEDFQRVMDPKVSGLEILFENLKSEPLQFFTLFSSVAATIPSLASSLSDYALANSYMDYFASAHNQNYPVVSIQWPSWSESGMGAAESDAYNKTGLLCHTDQEGLALLDIILGNQLGGALLPAIVNRDIWNPSSLMKTKAKSNALKSEAKKGLAESVAPKLPDNGNFDVSEKEAWLRRFFSDELNVPVDEIQIDIPFQEYGMESIMLAQVVARLERELGGVQIDPSVIIENSTIQLLARYFDQECSTTLLLHEHSSQESIPGDESEQSKENLASILKTKEEISDSDEEKPSENRVAVIGMSCHFPDAPDIGTFWENIKSGKDSIKEVPKERWDWKKYFKKSHFEEGKSISKWGAFIDGIDCFDADYFKIPESLALQMDPLERQCLEVSTEALADAGFSNDSLWGHKVGVFVGARSSNYSSKLTTIDKDVVVGLGQNFIAAHLSHFFNFKGPNMVVDAACASSLTAIHLAVQSIKAGESEVALAGGVEVLLDESPYLFLSAAQVLSPDGRCKTFDDSANGIGLGEGCGMLVLKSLDSAINDKDKIYGVIDGSAINNDGNTMGITTPNPNAQRELISEAITIARLDPTSISYVETHGTGTLIGDPIELNGLKKIFSADTNRKQFCGVGSVKSNVGHLLSAAGVAGIIKVLLSLVHRQLPPTIHCDKPNPRFNFESSPLFLVKELQDWVHEDVLRAGVSSFGLGGNNAHIIVSNDGVPDSQIATIESKGEKVIFNRKRYWPDKKVNTEERSVLNTITKPDSDSFLARKHEDNAFMDLFCTEIFVESRNRQNIRESNA
jgi:acyl transferase domain-containing protein/acyl carrier protein